MKWFLAVVLLAVATWSECKADDLPAYCGVNEEKYNYKPVPKSEGTLRQVHMAMRYYLFQFVNQNEYFYYCKLYNRLC